ncbi:MAG TPA: methyltransferase domain-containing protein [Candidatus Sulfotelmatobacter sp.]|nr:methyltransferase domain-containing protein [Candidatus Sulfotelmatobacter sp.]
MENRETASARCSEKGTYLLDNAGREAPARFSALSAMFDPGTIRHLEDRGVGPGWHCLEVGGGGGSVATWLCRRVGGAGRVVVTDLDTRFLETVKLPGLEVWQHDLTRDPLPEAAFDLVHARLVVVHLPDKEKTLEKLVVALKPGGWLIDEEFDSLSVQPDPAVGPGETPLKTHVAMGRLMADRGFERRCGRLLFARLRDRGLVSVGAEARMFMVQSESPGAALIRANYEQLRGDMIDGGYITERELEEDLARLDDPDFMMPSSILWSAWGRRP